jgi:hypothetical protein
MGSMFTLKKASTKIGVPANATIELKVPWTHCENCLSNNGKGITMKNLTVTVKNILNAYPDYFNEGFPSIAIFASHDFKSWYNFYSPQHVNMASIQTFHDTSIFINQSTGEACLGDVDVTYFVVCLNNFYYALNMKKGDYVAPPPFNDRCKQVYGVCGVPCADLKGGKYPNYCPSGVIENNFMFQPNATVLTYETNEPIIHWFNGITVVDWVVLIAIILDAFGNILRFLPVSLNICIICFYVCHNPNFNHITEIIIAFRSYLEDHRNCKRKIVRWW